MIKIELSVIISVYNEEAVLTAFYEEIKKIFANLHISYELIFVDDGSLDNSFSILKKISEQNKNVKIISFSTNFGHEAAMIAGIDNSKGKAIICMDADLQHPPSFISKMYEIFLEGYEIINMRRDKRNDGGLINNLASKLFYFILNKITKGNFEPNASDFFLISNKIAKLLKTNFRERNRFLRGYIQIIGFKKAVLHYNAPERYAGESKYSFVKLLFFSFSTIASFSKLPLRLGVITGIFSAFLGSIVTVYSIIMKILQEPVSGYTTLIVFMSFMFSIQFIVMGIIGEYVGYLFDESKKRPIYIINEELNL